MSSVGELIRAELLASTAVQNLVGSKIFPGAVQQSTQPPFIRYTVVSDVPQDSFTSGSQRTRYCRVQVDCYSTIYTEAQAIAVAVDSVLAELARPDLSCWRESSTDLYEDEDKLHRVSSDFSVWL